MRLKRYFDSDDEEDHTPKERLRTVLSNNWSDIRLDRRILGKCVDIDEYRKCSTEEAREQTVADGSREQRRAERQE